ncbi:MAG: hypothetical protein U0174_08940 [Polyangiaceae bacterium]
MSSDLRSCAGCDRHIRITEEACPFCGAIPSAEFRTPRERSAPLGKVGRAAVVAATVVVAAGVTTVTTACSSDSTSSSSGSPSPAYGIPIDDPDASNAALYGMPMLDAGDAADVNVSMGDAYGIPFDAGDGGKDSN